jgi:hypothetical protein
LAESAIGSPQKLQFFFTRFPGTPEGADLLVKCVP